MEAFQVLANSWPITVMFLGAVAGGVILYLIRWYKQSDHEDKAYRSSQAVVVRQYHDDAG